MKEKKVTKHCGGCDSTKYIDEFANDKKSKDGKTSKCKVCRNKNNQKYKSQSKDKTSEYNIKYNKEHKDKITELNKKNYQKAKDKKARKREKELADKLNINIIDNDEANEDEDIIEIEDSTEEVELIEGESKECSRCKKIKPLDKFDNRQPINGKYKDGKEYKCKVCSRNYTEEWRNKNPDQLSEYGKKWRKENPEKGYKRKTSEEIKKNKTERKEKFFNEFVDLVEQNGGSCIGIVGDYITAHTPISVKCGDGHEWKLCLNNIKKNRWCPICKTYTGELISLKSAEHLFGKKFKKIRPNWLKNKEGNCLELDIYNKPLKLAIEFNGLQHYNFIKFFHRTEEKFKKGVEADKLKIEKCKEHNINLIVIPYTVEPDYICKYIYTECIKLGIKPKNKPIDFDLGELRRMTNKTLKLEELIQSKNGELLEGIYTSRDSRVVVQCDKEHVWSTRIANIKAGHWCPECGLEVKDDTKEKISKTLKKFNKTKKGKAKKKVAHEKRSETMKKANEQLREETDSKQCAGKCKQIKPLDDFAKKAAGKLGRQSWCKQCTIANKQRIREEQKKKRETNGIKFSCDQCTKSYALKDSLTRHIKEKHKPSISLSTK